MSIAKRDVSHRNFCANLVRFRDRNVFIGERGATDQRESLITYNHAILNSQPIAYTLKRLSLTLFSALAVTDVQSSGIIIAGRQRRADGRVHASTEKNDGTRFSRLNHSASESFSH